MIADFRERLKRGDAVHGIMVTLTSPVVAEILADLGFDWLFIDAEHGPFDTADLLATLQTVGDRSACIVRVAAGEEALIKRTLDLGADGIIVPQVNSAEQAEQVVRFARYAPQGARGVGLGRAQGYGLRFQEYVETANERVSVIVQAEHFKAVENIEAIVQVPGVDAVLIGPYDLAASLGKMGQVQDPAVLEAVDHVTDACRAAGMPLGAFGLTAESVKPYAEKGFTFLVAGVDTLLLGQSAAKLLAELRS